MQNTNITINLSSSSPIISVNVTNKTIGKITKPLPTYFLSLYLDKTVVIATLDITVEWGRVGRTDRSPKTEDERPRECHFDH